jgi:hypothetical protein
MQKEMGYYDKLKMIQRLDERRAALKDYEQYADTVREIERLISMVEVTLDEKEPAK